MTIPYLMNCPHSGDSWCFDCINKLGKQRDLLLIATIMCLDCASPDRFEWGDRAINTFKILEKALERIEEIEDEAT